MDDSRLNQLQSQSTNGTEGVDDDVVEYFDGFWNYDSFKQRRAELTTDVIESLGFENRPQEFDLGSERVEEKVNEEINKRIEARSL